jgi:hypothetical protein
MVNCVTVWAQQHQVVVCAVGAVLILVMNLQYLCKFVVAAIPATRCSKSPYTGLIEKVTALRWMWLSGLLPPCSVSLPTNSLHPLHSTRSGAKSLGPVLLSWKENLAAFFAWALQQWLSKQCSGALSRTESSESVMADEVLTTCLALSKESWVSLFEYVMFTNPVALHPDLTSSGNFTASALTKFRSHGTIVPCRLSHLQGCFVGPI